MEAEQRPADLHLISTVEILLADDLAVDEGAVGAAQIAHRVGVALADQLSMIAGDFRVVQTDRMRMRAADGMDRVFQLEARTLIAALNDEQRSHASLFSRSTSGSRAPTDDFPEAPRFYG